MERGSYVPNVAAGNVEAALEELSALASHDLEAKRSVLDAACLLAACDGDSDPAERDALRRLARVLRAEGEQRSLESRLKHFAELAETPAIADSAAALGKSLVRHGVPELGVQAATVIALTSEGLSPGELSALRCLQSAAQLSDEALAQSIERADAALSRR